MRERAEILDIGLSFPEWSYTQQEIADRIGVTDPRLKRFFSHDHIRNRHLYLPPTTDIQAAGQRETVGQLLQRFVSGAEKMAGAAIEDCLNEKNVTVQEIDFICCVTSTGFITESG